MGTEGIKIEYGLKEVLERIERSISGLATKLDSKADHSDLEVLAVKIDTKADKTEVDAVKAEQRNVQRRLVTFAFSVALSAVGVALTIVLTSGGHP